MAFTPDGRTLVSSDFDGRVIAWDVDRGEVSEELLAHRGPVWALAVSQDGRTLYSAGNDGRLILWDLAGDRRLVRPFSLGQPFPEIQTPRGIAVSPDGGTLAYTHGDGTVDLVDTATLQRRRSIQAMRGFAAAVAFSSDGRLLAVGGDGGSITLWDARTLKPAGELTGPSGSIQTIAFSPDGKSLAAAEVEGGQRLRVRSVQRRAVIARADTMPITSLGFSPDGRLIALSAIDGGTEIRDARTPNSSNAFPRMAWRARSRSLQTGACLRWASSGATVSSIPPGPGRRSAAGSRATRSGSPTSSSRGMAARWQRRARTGRCCSGTWKPKSRSAHRFPSVPTRSSRSR